jgi:hypothetical protein
MVNPQLNQNLAGSQQICILEYKSGDWALICSSCTVRNSFLSVYLFKKIFFIHQTISITVTDCYRALTKFLSPSLINS